MKNIIWNNWGSPVVENCLSELEGEVISAVEGAEDGWETIITTESGKAIKIYHEQDCCENVSIEDSEVDDIVGGYCHFAGFVDGKTPANDEDNYCSSQTWSFLKIETSKGSIWQRWLGESNGYYSESVDILGGVVRGSAAHKEYMAKIGEAKEYSCFQTNSMKPTHTQGLWVTSGLEKF